MKDFFENESVKRLDQLAKHPFDLTKPDHLTPKRITDYVARSAGLKLLFATERVDDQVLSLFKDLVKETDTVGQMKAMQSGKIMNKIEGYPSENRSVLHTATRDFFDHPQTLEESASAARQAKKEVEKLKRFIEKLDKENRFTDLIMVAIGGSDLGPRAHYYALEHLKKPDRQIHFISNVDPDDAAAVLSRVNLSKSLVVVVSKSGSTLETLTNSELVRDRFVKAGLNPKDHFISVTMPGSLVDNRDLYLEVFHIWDWIGGRYSTTSMCGGVMLSFAFGFDLFWEFLEGAHAMDQAALKDDMRHNLPLMGALLSVWNRTLLGYPTLALIPYSQPLHRFPSHIQQVEMESNGKSIDRSGKRLSYPSGGIIWGEPGTNAQHSFYQLIHQGTDIIPLEFIAFQESVYGQDLVVQGTTSQQKLLSNLIAQSISLATGQSSDNPNKVFEGNRPSHIIVGKQLTPYSLGTLLAYFEHKVAFEGFFWNINSFDQEGVQLGKVTANKMMERFKAADPLSEPYPIGDAFLEAFFE